MYNIYLEETKKGLEKSKPIFIHTILSGAMLSL